MNKNQHVKHAFLVAFAAIAPALIEVFGPTGAFGHKAWAAPALAVVLWAVRTLTVGSIPPPVVLLVLVSPLLFGGATCKNIPGPIVPPGDGGPSFVNCSDAALHQAALNILPAAETAIAQANYEVAVAALIAGIGGPLAFAEVACALQWIASKAALEETATGDPLEATKAAHARAWLATHPVTFATAAL